MLAAAFPLIAVPVAWYLLGVVGAALHPRRESPLTVFAVVRGAAVLVLVTWIVTRWLDLSGRAALLVVSAAAVIALGVRVGKGWWRPVVVPERRDLPMLALATLFLTAWIAPVTRHGLGAMGTGNHADLPSYLLQAVYLFEHGFAATGALPGISPESRMFDGFGASALLAPSTAVAAAPSIGVMVTLLLGAVLVGQLVDRLSSRVLEGARVAPLMIGLILIVSGTFTFMAFAYFLAQVWGLAFGVGLVAALLTGERGVPAIANAVVVSVAGILTYNPTGAMYAGTALLLGAWLVAIAIVRKRPVLRMPAFGLVAGVLVGGVVFFSVWHQAADRLWALRDAVAGWPMAPAPLWSAVGIPTSAQGNSVPAVIAGSCVVAAIAAAGWLATPRGRRMLVLSWPLVIPVLVWLYRAHEDAGSYQQGKAFAYVQPLLAVWVACGVILLAQRIAAPLPALRTPRMREALPGVLAACLLVSAAWFAFWPRTYFGDGGCCIATRTQIDQIQAAAEQSPGRVRVSGGNVWVNDVATAIISRERSVSVDPPSIWPSQAVEPFGGTVSFETGTHPSLVEGRFVFAPATAAATASAR